MKFNEKLIKIRKEKGLSQEALGEKLDVARQTISKWELGETTPEMDKLVKLSELFEISLDELIKDDSEISVAEDTNNNLNNTNSQKLAGIVIIILKVIGVLIVIGIVLAIIGAICFGTMTSVERVEENSVLFIEE